LAPKPLNEKSLTLLKGYWTQAIKQKATYASLLAYKILIQKKEALYLALQAAKEGDDYRALERIVQTLSLKKIEDLCDEVYDLGYDDILYNLVIRSTCIDLEKVDTLLQRAIQAYGNAAPARILADAALAKSKLKHWLEADVLYTQAIQAYGNAAPARILANAAYAKLNLNHWLEADTLYTRIIQTSGNQTSIILLAQVAFTKFKLKWWPEADVLFTQVISGLENKILSKLFIINVFIHAALVKLELSKWQEAEELYMRGMQVKENAIISALLLEKINFIEKQLQQLLPPNKL
jgi:hypothetical protein